MKSGEDRNMMHSNILITGGSGFVGRNLIEYLYTHYDYPGVQIYAPTRGQMDLMCKQSIKKALNDFQPTCIIHLAAVCGGIGANANAPGRFIMDNLKISTNLIDLALQYKICKFINLGSICAYPKHCPVPFKENTIWDGYPEETNAPYGIAKKTIVELLISLHKQYGFNSTNLFPTNMYGPHDNFDLENSHVIPAIIRKIIEAQENNENSITLWGTGKATRDFLYVEDCCRAIHLALGKNTGPDPINIGTDQEYSIQFVADKIAAHLGFEGEIIWNSNKPDGQPRRWVDISRARSILKYTPHFLIDDGLSKTIRWVLQHQERLVVPPYSYCTILGPSALTVVEKDEPYDYLSYIQ